jgi:hypothetical protein
MNTLHLIFSILALACFVAAAANMPSKINLQALGLAFLAAAILFV